LEEVCKKAGGDWDKGIVDRIWAFGPLKAGGCLLIDARKNVKTPRSYVRPLVPVNRSDFSFVPGYEGGWIERERLKVLWRF